MYVKHKICDRDMVIDTCSTKLFNRIGGSIVILLAQSAVKCPAFVKPTIFKFVVTVILLSTQHEDVRSNYDWLGIGIICPSGATCLSVDLCVSELAHERCIQYNSLMARIELITYEVLGTVQVDVNGCTIRSWPR